MAIVSKVSAGTITKVSGPFSEPSEATYLAWAKACRTGANNDTHKTANTKRSRPDPPNRRFVISQAPFAPSSDPRVVDVLLSLLE
jgi:hypothetical protein